MPLGIRLDSGDLGSLSTMARAKLREAAAKYQEVLPGVCVCVCVCVCVYTCTYTCAYIHIGIARVEGICMCVYACVCV